MTVEYSSDAKSEEIEMNGDQHIEEGTEEKEDIEDIPSFKEQKQLLHDAVREGLVVGQEWYMVDHTWYIQCKKYIEAGLSGHDPQSEYPGPIDNTPLFSTGTQKLKEHLLENSHFELVSSKGWEKLVKWFGMAEGQEPIKRTVIEHGLYTKERKVEIYPLELKICLFKDTDRVLSKQFSKITILDDVIKQMKETLGVPEDEDVRLWNKFIPNTYELLVKTDNTLQDHGVGSGQMLVLEQKNERNEWPRQTRTRSLSGSSSMSISSSPPDTSSFAFPSGYSSYSSFASSRQRQLSTSVQRGLCGLSNLGNTCFMNSALQCLSNTTPLMKYFLAQTYKHDLNPTNPLGMHGKVAEAYADLQNMMWSGQNSYVTPRQFKMVVGRFAPQFSGYQQQDSQELLAFLLDGLHEDLNRVKQKPYIELQDDKGRCDEVLADEAWVNHSKRNCSVITDNFHGLFKSTVECPDCGKRSITFDPFCYLSLPLPIKRERNLFITFVPIDHSKIPVKMKVVIPKLSTASVLCEAVSKMTGVDADKLVVTDVFSSKFHRKFNRSDSLNNITDKDDIFVYEIPIQMKAIEDSELLVLPVYHRLIGKQSTYSHSSTSLFGIPMIIAVPRESITANDLYNIILKATRRFVTTPFATTEKQREENNGKKVIEKTDDDVEEEEEEENKPMENDESDVDMTDPDNSDETSEKEKHESETRPVRAPSRLFEMKVVNHSANTDFRTFNYDDDEHLKLTSRMYLAIDWYPKTKEQYYDGSKALGTEQHSSVREMRNPKNNSIHLSDCLELFLQREKLGEQDPWYCPKCKEHRQAFKKFDLWSLPKVLVIHLKRFSYNRYFRDKLDALVNFPVRALDLTDYVINKNHPRAVYDLHAVSNHYGGLGGGHYTAYAVNCYDGQWYYFDDSSVSSSDAASPVSKAAYVLFYTRRDDPDCEIMNTSELLTEYGHLLE